VNYFLKDKDGKYLNAILDKTVWILWAELRVNGDVDAIKTPTGFIPKYEDLAGLFKEKLNKNYSKDDMPNSLLSEFRTCWQRSTA
jgi:phosphoenolpyruvate carboxykinase (GTP)